MNSKGYLGIDVSKGYADFLLIDSQGKTLENNFRLIDNRTGRKMLLQLIEQWQEQGVTELYCGVESTGGYENNWYALLKGLQTQEKVFAARINPRAIKAVSNAVLRRTITDSVSAENIALYLVKFLDELVYSIKDNSREEYKDGRIHLTAIQMHKKQRTQLYNQLGMWLYGSFPEILVYCRNGIPSWLLRMLVKYPTAKKVVNARTGLASIQGITAEKAKALRTKALENDFSTSTQMAHIIATTASEILHKTEVIEREEEFLISLYKDDAQVRLLTSIPGVGLASAVTFILEIEDVTRFDSVKKLAAYFGVHPTFKQSGDGQWGSYMSKRGRGTLRRALYMCAMAGMRCNPVLKPIYKRCRERGMKHNEALGVIMHKLLRIVYGMLKSEKVFNAAIDQHNQEQAMEKQNLEMQNLKEKTKEGKRKLYRYQKLEASGPISGRRAAKINKQAASQAPLKGENTGLPPANTNL